MELEYKIVPTEFKAREDGQYEGYFGVFRNIDDGNDVVEPGAFLKTIQERAKRVKVFYMHMWDKLIGPPPRELREDSYGLFAAGKLTLESFWGRETYALMKDEALTEGSFGYETVKADFDNSGTRHLRELKLIEISPVPLGMNPLTEVRAMKHAFFRAQQAVIPARKAALADLATKWDAGAVLPELVSAKQLRMAHAWMDPDGDPDDVASYKFPHHTADGKVVWEAVEAAGAALLLGGQGLSEQDADGVKRHLAVHYAQFEKTPVWEKGASFEVYADTFARLLEEMKEGRVLSSANRGKVKDAIGAIEAAREALQTVLDASEPPAPPKARDDVARRLRLAETRLKLVTA